MTGKPIRKVSVHGGHSGQFCNHARDTLEEVIQTYITRGFTWAGITEHLAPLSDDTRYPDEAADGLSADFLRQRFTDYFAHCRRLRDKYRGQIELFTAFETETYPGSDAYVKAQIRALKPDYIVGSVHHVAGIGFDVSPELYGKAVAATGSVDQLYLDYFDAQYGMLQALEPAVVGHFDLIRIFDREYLSRFRNPEIWARIERNLGLIAEHDLILDFNLRGFDKSMEQYPSMPVLKKALELGVTVVPGDDSHGVDSVGRNYEQGIALLVSLGADTDWPKPRLIDYD